MRAAEVPSLAGQYVSIAKTMPAFSSSGCSSEFSREMIGRSCRPRPRPCANCRPKAASSLSNPKSCARGSVSAPTSDDTPGLTRAERPAHPLARLLVGVDLGGRRRPDPERPVVAGPVAVEGVDDVEE